MQPGNGFVPAISGLSLYSQKLSKTNMEMLMAKIPGLRRKDNMEKRKLEEFMKGEFHEQTKKLIDNMIKALHADHNSIKHKTGPALARIKMLRQIDD